MPTVVCMNVFSAIYHNCWEIPVSTGEFVVLVALIHG